ncbi:hypothetical protein DYH09_23615 [bacterium CPR1]|nr:hypothetical protein [bacterium CPR1]
MSEEITTPEETPTEEPTPVPPSPPPAPEGVQLTPQATRNLKGLVNEVRRIKKLMGARALENKPTNDLEDVLDSISEKILWCLETEVGL